MGRYYNGDIEGKMWFAVQPSDDADHFGVKGYQPDILQYYFTEEDKEGVKEGINKCLEQLGEYEQILNEYFATHNGYNEQELIEAGIPRGKLFDVLQQYARLELGKKILACLEEQGSCEFEVEL